MALRVKNAHRWGVAGVPCNFAQKHKLHKEQISKVAAAAAASVSGTRDALTRSGEAPRALNCVVSVRWCGLDKTVVSLQCYIIGLLVMVNCDAMHGFLCMFTKM